MEWRALVSARRTVVAVGLWDSTVNCVVGGRSLNWKMPYALPSLEASPPE